MVDAVDSLRSYVLSDQEIKQLTGWPDAMIEDYRSILEGLTRVAQEVDTVDGQIISSDSAISNIRGVTTNLARLLSAVSQVQGSDVTSKERARLNQLEKIVTGQEEIITQLELSIAKLLAKTNEQQTMIDNINQAVNS